MSTKQNESHLNKWYLDVLVHSETELDNLQDIESVLSCTSPRMSWSGQGSDNHAFQNEEAENVYPLRPGTAPPRHHHHPPKSSKTLEKGGKTKRKSNVSFDINISEGQNSSKKSAGDVHPLPESQTDIPIFSVSPTKAPPLRQNSTFSSIPLVSQISNEDGTHKNTRKRRHKRSSRDHRQNMPPSISPPSTSPPSASPPSMRPKKSDGENEIEDAIVPVRRHESHMSQAKWTIFKKFHEDQIMSQESIIQYVKAHIKQKECKTYIQSMRDDSLKCSCGRDKKYHIDHGIDVEKDKDLPGEKWQGSEVDCNSFGEIYFQGFGERTNNSPYIRVSSDTKPCHIWELMIEYWKMPFPKLLISVTGGAKRFEMKYRMKSLLKQGLVDAALSTGAWIVSGGTSAGVMQFVGEAVKDHITLYGNEQQCVALGVATWGIVANKSALTGEQDGKGKFPATYTAEVVREDNLKRLSALDFNHTHFILVDDGSEGKFGMEIDLRTRLEEYISFIGTVGVSENQVISIPAVLIVVEGGQGTMRTVLQSLLRLTPVVVVKGSGRVADFIAEGYEKTRDPQSDDHSVFPNDFKEQMTQAAIKLFKEERLSRSSEKCIEDLKECLKKRNLVNVFDLETSDTVKDIDRAILNALLRANKGDNISQLSLALAWNRCDIARQQIFTSDNMSKWTSKHLYNAMFTALVQDQADFVKLFLDNGVDLHKFLTVETLWNLYCNCLNEDTDGEASILRQMMMFLDQGWGAYLTCRRLKEWSDLDMDRVIYLIGRVICRLLRNEAFQFYSDESKYVVHSGTETTHWMDGEHGFENPEFELFLFAILFNRRQMVKVFLREGNDQIGTALLGCALLHALSSKADLDEEVSISMDLAEHAESLEHFAISVLSECYKRSKLDAHKLLVRELPHLGNTTLLTLAEQRELMNFVEHSACQTKLSQIWKGSLITHTSEFKICLTLLFPPMIIFMKFMERRRRRNKSFKNDEKDGKPKVSPFKSVSSDKTLNETASKQFISSNPRKFDKTKRTQYAEVKMFGCGEDGAINLVRAFYKFYRAPVTKFYANIIAYLVLLGLFSYFLLTNLHSVEYPDSPSTFECIVWAWFGTLMLEEIRQVFIRDPTSLGYKVRSWWSNTWNRFDMLMYLGIITSIILRYSLDEPDFVYVRIMYSITLAMCCLRLMQYFYASRNMGPKVIMIRRMLVDLMFFFVILLVFLLSFGVAYHINMFPNAPVDWSILFNVLYYPYFQIYGELFLENLKGEEVDGCTRNESIWRHNPMDRCAEKNVIVPILLAFYMILTNVLLVNLLIAMFSYTFQRVQDNSTKVWRFYRISLVYEYFDRPSFVPPIIVLNHLWRAGRYLLFKYKKFNVTKRHNLFRLDLTPAENQRLALFEKRSTDAHLTNHITKEREKLDKKVALTAERIEIVIGELQRVKETVQQQEMMKTNEVTHTSVTPLTGTPRAPLDLHRHAWDTPRDVSSSVHAQLESLQIQSLENTQQLEKITKLLGQVLHQQRTFPPPPSLQSQILKTTADVSDPED